MIRLPRRNVAIKMFHDPDESPGGIIIPDIAKTRSKQGIVKYVAEGCKDLRVGDHVLFGAYDGTVIYVQGEGRLLIVSEEVIPCVINVFEDVKVTGVYWDPDTVGLHGPTIDYPTVSELIEFIYAALDERNPAHKIKSKSNLENERPVTQKRDR